MAYSPIEQSRLAHNAKLTEFAGRHGLTPTQAALAWLLAKDDVMVIPKTGRRDRLRENMAALERPLSAAQAAELDRLFPPPKGPQALEMI
jgi:aldehyde reductase